MISPALEVLLSLAVIQLKLSKPFPVPLDIDLTSCYLAQEWLDLEIFCQ